MPVQPTYPGVYIEELPSGVRTITGVSTSTAVFIARAKKGPMDSPVLCLGFPDFERTFSSENAHNELPQQVRLFFENGGTRCYVLRIAHGSQAAKVTLQAEDATLAVPKPVLEVTAKSRGVVGDKVRLAVTYRGPHPESTFNLEVFRWGRDAGGNLARLDTETLTALSMDPANPRYVVKHVNQASKLIEVKDVSTAPTTPGYSQSGRPVPSQDDATFRNQWKDRLGKAAVVGTNQFRISVAGNSFVNVDLRGLDFTQDNLVTDTDARANLDERITEVINNALPAGAQVTVSFETGPTATTGATTLLRISSTNGDVRIEPAAANDLAASLMLGTAQGGLEVPRYADRRPAPTGIVFKRSDIVSFAQRNQNAFDRITIAGKNVDPLRLVTVTTAGTHLMFEDAVSPSATGNSDGVREKMGIIAAKINEKSLADPTFAWQAEVWGSRLAILPTAGADNDMASVATGGGVGDVDIVASFQPNVRFYSLGTTGTGIFQGSGVAGNDGTKPELADYRAAFDTLRKEIDLFNLLLLPADDEHTAAERAAVWGPASAFCQQQRAFLLIDGPDWATAQDATHPTTGVNRLRQGVVKDHAAVFYPRVTVSDGGGVANVGASGAIAGVMARIDASRGVWKAPAGTEADIRGVVGLERRFSDLENGVLNPRAINTLRIFSSGIVSWGARTLDGDDDFGSQWKYIPVRRLALYIEESLYRGTQWVVFEPNDEPLWSQIRLNIGAFMNTLFRQGAFQGKTPREAYLVKCDKETTTQDDINRGVVNILVGFAPLKPAEFVIIQIQQLAGQIQT